MDEEEVEDEGVVDADFSAKKILSAQTYDEGGCQRLSAKVFAR